MGSNPTPGRRLLLFVFTISQMVEQWTVLVICQISIVKICKNVIKCVIREDIIANNGFQNK